MATEDDALPERPIDRVMEDVRAELVRRVAREDREAHRDVYDELADR